MRSLLFVVTSDPRVSHRPGEAIRIAAGVSAWKKVQVQLCLHGSAVLSLSEFPQDLQNGENIARYLPMLNEGSSRIYAQAEAKELASIGNAPVSYERISPSGFARIVSQSTYVAHF